METNYELLEEVVRELTGGTLPEDELEWLRVVAVLVRQRDAGWISTHEKLPTPKQRVKIAYIPDGLHYSYGVDWVRDYRPDYGWHVRTPTHWMPVDEETT